MRSSSGSSPRSLIVAEQKVDNWLSNSKSDDSLKSFSGIILLRYLDTTRLAEQKIYSQISI